MDNKRTILSLLYSSLIPRHAIIDAILYDDLAKARKLLKHNPDLVYTKNNYGATPLHWAAAKGHEEMVKLLLINKARVDSKNIYGQTPIELALMNGYPEIKEMLLQHGRKN